MGDRQSDRLHCGPYHLGLAEDVPVLNHERATLSRAQSCRPDGKTVTAANASPRGEGPDRGEQDAEALVQFLTEHVRHLMSPVGEPVPPCPRCGGTDIAKRGYQRRCKGRLPVYECRSCGVNFNRLAGSPLAHRLFRNRIYEYIALLPQPLSFREAARQLGVMDFTVGSVVRLFRRWLLELDPSGQYERGVRLGGRIGAQQALPPPPVDEEVVREDVGLTAVLLADFEHLHSPNGGQLPACPYCNGRTVSSHGRQGKFPRFLCRECGKKFTRRTGTPFCRNRPQGERRQRELIRYLGLPLPTAQLAETLDALESITERLIQEFRERCDQLDPSGQLVSRIRAGIRPATDTPCLHCGARRVQFAVRGPGSCAQCGRIISMRRPVYERSGVLEAGPWEWSDKAP